MNGVAITALMFFHVGTCDGYAYRVYITSVFNFYVNCMQRTLCICCSDKRIE